MDFEPDIIVTSTDGFDVLLVADTKWKESDVPETEVQLKSYMRSISSPIGLLVTPTRLRIYRDEYVALADESIGLLGEYDVSKLFGAYSGQHGRTAAQRFESDVQNWLESLTFASAQSISSDDLKKAVETNLIPAVSAGLVRAAHPRPALTA